MKFTEDSAPVKSCRILLAGCLSASWLVAASAHANTITVTNTSDSGRGSLRQAMANANDGDTINATNVSGSIELSSGELLVNKSVTINGPGHKRLSVENAGPSRVFEIAAGEIVTISGLAINNGQAHLGGGLYNAGSLTVIECSISGNEAGRIRENGLGGGIYNASGAKIAIINSTISGNGADQGGGIYNAGLMQIASTTVSDNFVWSGFSQLISLGGAFCNGGTLDIVNSTITGNRASGSVHSGGIGGGIFNSATLAIINTTISANVAGGAGVSPGHGGGVANGSGKVVIQNSTITGNTAGGPSGSGFGGNLFIAEGTLEIGNTILNTDSDANIFSFGNQGTVISDGYNLSNDNGAGYLTAAGDQININPRLGPLQNNGGPTFTHALLVDSPAVNAGNPSYNPNSFQQPLIYDQRGPGFDRVKNWRSDIGAFEMQAAPLRPTPPPTPTPRPTPPPTPPPSPTPPASPTPPPSPTPTEDPREVAIAKIRREMRFTRTALRELNGTTSVPLSVSVWLKVRLRVLKARLAYPLDEALARIDQRLLNGGPMSDASRRDLLTRLNARLDALRSGR
jgi:hypothetical protein